MNFKSVVFFSTVSFFVLTGVAEAQNKYTTAQDQQPKSIWEDESAANPYFKSSRPKASSASAQETKKKVREPKRSTFKRRVYTGPSKAEIAEAASKKAVENFKTFMSNENYDVKYGNISYDVAGDSLSVTDVSMVPKVKEGQGKVVPYYMTAKEITLRNFNIGEKNGKPLLKNGEMKARKIEIPVWDENAVKKGKIEISQLTMNGDVPAYMKAQGVGELDKVEVRDFRSETIINETILNNVVRSKVFSASTASFFGVELQKELIDSLKYQNLDGLKFETARVNTRPIPTLEGVAAAMTSYSARILNTDLVVGARLEAQKENPDPNLEQLKKNAEENKAAIKAVEEEMGQASDHSEKTEEKADTTKITDASKKSE